MAERDHFSEEFKDQFPAWRCPRCWHGTMKRIDGSLREELTGSSNIGRDHDAWEPDWDEFRFVGLLKCTQTDCLEVVCVSGTRTQTVYQVDWDRYEEDKFYRPKAISPGIPVFRINEKCPEPIQEELRVAFELFWSDLGACANRLRIAIERLLDERKINKTNGKSKKAKDRLTTHDRIGLLAAKFPEATEHLMAIKWLGNTGSHFGDADREDILDAFELIEAVIDEIYIGTAASLKRKATSLSKRKGRPKTLRAGSS
jgi:hypothetical protein